MIVVPGSSDERSPLKASAPHLPPPSLLTGAPPPYSPPGQAPPNRAYYQTIQMRPQENVSQRTFSRFIRAFLVAVAIIFLWGMFVDSVDIAARMSKSKAGGEYSIADFFRTFTDRFSSAPHPGVSTPPSPCAPSSIARPLPIQYPPYVVLKQSSVP